MATPALYKDADRGTETSEQDPKVVVLNKQINIRVSDEDIEAIDSMIRILEKKTPGLKLTRSEMARIALIRGLSELKKEEDE